MSYPPRHRKLANLLKKGFRYAHKTMEGAKRAPCRGHLWPMLSQEGGGSRETGRQHRPHNCICWNSTSVAQAFRAVRAPLIEFAEPLDIRAQSASIAVPGGCCETVCCGRSRGWGRRAQSGPFGWQHSRLVGFRGFTSRPSRLLRRPRHHRLWLHDQQAWLRHEAHAFFVEIPIRPPILASID